MKIKIVKTTDHDYKPLLTRLLQRDGNRQGGVEKRVGEIVGAVERKGDSALLRYAQMFDRVRLTRATMEVKPGEIEKAMTTVPAKDLRILRMAAREISSSPRRSGWFSAKSISIPSPCQARFFCSRTRAPIPSTSPRICFPRPSTTNVRPPCA